MNKSNQNTNRLIKETSTYLLQHAHNPVDWYAWDQEALDKAKREDKPILLSIGYAACHWCHVMEHESFEDHDTAKLMNESFVNIKVDREERTDLDEIYMKAVQMMTGHGGWPMTVFLTPNLSPFFGGTYFPPEDRHGLPSFKRLLISIINAWKTQRKSLEDSAYEITQHLFAFDNSVISQNKQEKETELFKHDNINVAIDHHLATFDRHWGGFGNAPKFPHTMSLALAMRYALPHSIVNIDKQRECLDLVKITLDRMAYGGIHDQLGGGFARYSVDRYWLIPHFEKMLYDNALLCQSYFEGYLLTGRSYWKQVAENILQFVLRELQSEEGAFFSSLDADSEKEEGKYYVWTAAEFKSVLKQENVSEEDINLLANIYGVTEGGNFEHGKNVLNLTKSPEEFIERYKISEDEFWLKLDLLGEKLLKIRSKRVRPQRDEKVLTSWNSLMISAFVDGYKVTGKDQYLQAAVKATNFILSQLMSSPNRLLRTWGQGKAKLNAYLDDYAYFVQALLDLASVDLNDIWLEKAKTLTESMLQHFWDEKQNGFFYTSDDHEEILMRSKNHFDASIPSGTSVAVFNLLRLARLLDNKLYFQKAEQLFDLYMPFMLKAPDQFANLWCAFDLYLSNPLEIALLTDTKIGDYQEYLKVIYGHYFPNKVMILKDLAKKYNQASAIYNSPLLQQKKLIDEKTTVYICRNYTCDAPINNLSVLKTKMQEYR